MQSTIISNYSTNDINYIIQSNLIYSTINVAISSHQYTLIL